MNGPPRSLRLRQTLSIKGESDALSSQAKSIAAPPIQQQQNRENSTGLGDRYMHVAYGIFRSL
jgi:hypothetical protein